MMARTVGEDGQPPPAASGWPAVGAVAAYAAAIVALAYALMSLYWALGGHGLVSTIGGYVEQFARRGGALPVPVALAPTLAKGAGWPARAGDGASPGAGGFRAGGCCAGSA